MHVDMVVQAIKDTNRRAAKTVRYLHIGIWTIVHVSKLSVNVEASEFMRLLILFNYISRKIIADLFSVTVRTIMKYNISEIK